MAKRKKLTDSLILAGTLENITMMELRESPGDIIAQAALGRSFIISKSGRPIAVLSRLPGEQLGMIISRDGKTTYAR